MQNPTVPASVVHGAPYMAPAPAFAGAEIVHGAAVAGAQVPVVVSTVPQQQVKRELEIDEDLLLWLVDQTRMTGDYHAWAEKVTLDDRVVSNTELVTAVLASENFFRNLVAMQ